MSVVGVFGAPVPPGEPENRFCIFAFQDPTKGSEDEIQNGNTPPKIWRETVSNCDRKEDLQCGPVYRVSGKLEFL